MQQPFCCNHRHVYMPSSFSYVLCVWLNVQSLVGSEECAHNKGVCDTILTVQKITGTKKLLV